MTEKGREPITDHWLDSKFKRIYPGRMGSILREKAWSIPGPFNIKGGNGYYEAYSTFPGDEVNYENEHFKFTFQDQLDRYIELMEELES